MNTLPLSPLPFETSEESRSFRRIDIEGFVDEQVVSRVIARGAYNRTTAEPDGMVLSSSVDDYAGWAPPVESPFVKMAERPGIAPAPVGDSLPARPWSSLELDVEKPYEGGHRWWLFGMAGAIACGIIAVSLMSLGQHRNISGTTDSGIPAQQWHETPAVDGKPPAIPASITNARPPAR